MSMTKEELMNVFREAASAEFSEFSPYESDYTYEFSERFEKRMDRLIRAESRATWRFVHTKPTRLILIAVAVIATLFLVACTVPEVRESIAGFFIRMFSNHDEIAIPHSTKNEIEAEFGLYSIPEGFEAYYYYRDKETMEIRYKNENNVEIVFRQQAGNIIQVVDNENADIIKKSIGGKSVLVYQNNDDALIAIWEVDGYFFYLYSSADIDFTTVESLISSIRPVE